MSGFQHETVLAHEVVAALAPRPGAAAWSDAWAESPRYVDGTLGGGGHAAGLLGLADGRARVIGIDRDPAALAAARARLADVGDRLVTVHGRFGALADVLTGCGLRAEPDGVAGGGAPGPIAGFVLDLGVSSPQLDHADRGFSFSHAGPIDMRMDPTQGPTALDLLRVLPEDEVSTILRDYGEERYHRRIARLIKDAAMTGAVATTAELAALVATAIPMAEQRKSRIHPATRTFQALRIAVNGELDELRDFLRLFPSWLAPGGRCAIISFHSLEDRLVKNAFRDLGWTSSLPPRYAAQAGERTEAVCVAVSKKPIEAGEAEVARNPRARSAKLRVCERTTAPHRPMHLAPGAP